jgi:DNA-binding NarL/FixJ family response regulator
MTDMTQNRRIKVLSVDDHPLLSEGIAAIISAQADMELVGQGVDARSGIEMYRQHRPDVTLLDVRLPDMSGIDVLIALRAEFINARIIMLSTFQGDVEIQRALEAGARGFLLKSMPNKELVVAIRQVHAGKKCVPPQVAAHLAEYLAEEDLTAREIEVLALISAGNGNRDVADALSITEDTVKGHVRHIMEKLGAQDRTEAVVIAVRRGIIQI